MISSEGSVMNMTPNPNFTCTMCIEHMQNNCALASLICKPNWLGLRVMYFPSYIA